MHFYEFQSSNQLDRLAVMLLHSVWQATLIVCIARLLGRWLWNAPSESPIRYAIQTSAMVSILLMPILTWIWVGDSPRLSATRVRLVDSAIHKPITESGSAMLGGEETQRASRSTAIVDTQKRTIVQATSSTHEPPLSEQASSLSPALIIKRSVAGLWLVGVAFFSLKLLRGLIANIALQKNIALPTEAVRMRIQVISQRLGWKRVPRVGVSDRVQQAVVTGYFRSVVLLPFAWTTQVPVDVLDAVIAHELAHVRRLDTWVILLQRIAETLLFFHPAVWWLSGRISYERELCCDQLAVRATGCADKYATALEHIGRLLQQMQPIAGCQLSPGLGGQKMELLHRIKLVLAAKTDGSDRIRTSPLAIAAAIPLLWIGLIVVLMRVPAAAQPPSDKTTSTVPAQHQSVSASASQTSGESKTDGMKIQELPNRVYVELSGPATLNDEVIARLQEFQNPVSLTIRDDVDFSPDDDVARLRSVTRLVQISFVQPIADRHLQHLAELELTGLCLKRATLSREGMRQLAKFRHLSSVGLWEMDVDDDDVRELLKLKSLRKLQLQNCKITPAIIPDVARLTGLTSLHLQGCPLRAADVVKLATLLPNLKSLDISSAGHDDPFTGDAILSACGRFRSLKFLSLEGVTCTIDGIRHLKSSATLHMISLSGTIGPLFYPKIGPAYLKARELRFAALYTSDKSYFGGRANWQDSRFTLDAVYGGELISQAEYHSLRETGGAMASANKTESAIAFPPSILIREWRRGMSEEEFKTENGQLSPRVAETDEHEQWTNGNPTRLHSATVEVTARCDGRWTFCRGVALDHQGLVAVPTEIFREHDKSAGEIEIRVAKAPLSEKFEGEIVGHHGPVTLIRSKCEPPHVMPISSTRPSTGDLVFAIENVRWNGHLAIGGILAGQETVIVPPSLESFSYDPVTHTDLIVSNLSQSAEHLGTPLANEAGELIGLCLPLKNSDGRGYAVSVAHLRSQLTALNSTSRPQLE